MPSAFSEISAAASLLRGILGPARAATAPAPADAAAPAPAPPPATHAGRIEQALDRACRALGASGGLVADADGLALAVLRSALPGEAAPVTAAILGAALAQAHQVLGAGDGPAAGAAAVQQATLRLSGPDRLVLRPTRQAEPAEQPSPQQAGRARRG